MVAIAVDGPAYRFGEVSESQLRRLEGPRRPARHVSSRAPRLLALPDLMQRTDYTCGPASLRAVLGLYGMGDVPEAALAHAARTSSEVGTEPEELAQAARSFGLAAEVCTGMTLGDLEENVRAGIAVIVNYQAWRDARLTTPWREHWGDGHFAVVAGVDDAHVYLEDPWMVGRFDRIACAEFVERWHGGQDRDGRRFLQGGIVLRPR